MGKEHKEGRPLRTVFMYNKKHVLLRLRMSGLEVVDIEKIYKKDFLPISLFSFFNNRKFKLMDSKEAYS